MDKVDRTKYKQLVNDALREYYGEYGYRGNKTTPWLLAEALEQCMEELDEIGDRCETCSTCASHGDHWEDEDDK